MKLRERRESAPEEIPFGDFPAFYAAHERTLRATLFQVAGREVLDDLVQTTLIRCWENRWQFKGESKLSTWAIRIAIRVAIDHFRSSKRSRSWAPLEEAEAIPDLRLRLADTALADRALVAQGLAELDDLHRIVVTLRYFQDLSLEEITVIVDEPLGTVKSRLHYAKKKLREFFREKGVEV